ncbi:hypothetical protein ABFE25_19800 [Bacillus toyonensis]|uniref:hypothetical protein n=1 Tax=Bacillus toyonensis TaxID=155322 RepID=UPI00321B5FF0
MIITKVAPISGFIGAIIALVVNAHFINTGKKAEVRQHADQLKKSGQKSHFGVVCLVKNSKFNAKENFAFDLLLIMIYNLKFLTL